MDNWLKSNEGRKGKYYETVAAQKVSKHYLIELSPSRIIVNNFKHLKNFLSN